ncbi:SdpA family antimicrobial peptide system protein [Streptomyces sp. NPDC059874]|uniref:SdpA family antimicrobial peptide system protein n=1 Tax=Streptomyces sp. NPDC059874 TaxID=3346983 RepID=UPI003654798D
MKNRLRSTYSAFVRQGENSVSVPTKAIVVVVAVWAVVIAYVVQEQIPRNVVTLPAQKAARHAVVNIAPQGWAFFTKSPRDPEVIPFGKKAGEGGMDWKPLSLTPHASPRNAFGLNRESRAQGVEISMLLAAAQKDDWRDCTEGRRDCLAQYGDPARQIGNGSPDPTLCGTVGLLQERPTPWAWRDLLSDSHSVERVMVLEVTC